MAANNIIKVTDIDFDTIKNNLKEYLSSQGEFKDYDFEASTMQVILNLLAYNTYYNSFYLNMVSNEMFLDSAIQRSSVVSRAKMLGYTPASYKGATAVINFKITPIDNPPFITVPKNTTFSTTVNGVTYKFVNDTSQIIVPDDDGIYQRQFNIVEGTPLTYSYTVSALNPVRYIIPNERVDSRSIEVLVQESIANNTTTVFTQADNLYNTTGTSPVFFLQENELGKSELLFGDGIIGKALKNGNIVNISYRVCNGTDCNNLSSFSIPGAVDGYSGAAASTIIAATGGANTETIESIKYNAPRIYESQNRAVTKEDYKRLVLNYFNDIQSISVWGGEENEPPAYGKVFISCKPYGSALLSTTRKEEIIDYLSARKVVSIEPEIVDATYMYIEPEINVRYNPTLTSSSASQIINKMQNNIISYESVNLGKYNGRFIASQFIDIISKTNDSIVSVDVKDRIHKRFTPTANVTSTYTIPFNQQLQSITSGFSLTIEPGAHPGRGLTLSSSAFTYNGFKAYMDDDGFSNIRFYYLNPLGRRIYLNYSAGTVDYSTGLVKLNSVKIESSTEIQISVVPYEHDVTTVRNQLLLIAGARINLYNDLTGELVGATTSVNTEGGTSSIIEDAIINIVY